MKPHPSVKFLLDFFSYGHLSPELQRVSQPFHGVAHRVAAGPQNAETTACLRKLLEAKDCAVRSYVSENKGGGVL